MTSSYNKDWFQDPPDLAPSSYEPPENPLDSMPIATYKNRYADPEHQAEIEAILEQNPRPEEDMAEWFNDKSEKKEDKSIHQKMYEIATNRYNPFSVGGSENCDSDISCNQ